jgi:sec-independent protein translocase protein TatC
MAQPSPERDAESQADEGRELTLLEHLQELRQRVTIAAGAIILCMVAALVFAPQIIEFLAAPARDSINEDFRLVYTEPLGYLSSYIRVGLLAGISGAMPIIIYEAIMFIAPGLTPQEKRWVLPVVIGAGLSFVAGAAFTYFIIMPKALGFLLTFGEGVAEPFIRIDSYIDFVTRLILVVGVAFEMPLVIMGLAKIGLVNYHKLIGFWRYAVVGAFVLGAIATPTIDPVTQSLVAGPILGLYVLGIVLARVVEPRDRYRY